MARRRQIEKGETSGMEGFSMRIGDDIGFVLIVKKIEYFPLYFCTIFTLSNVYISELEKLIFYTVQWRTQLDRDTFPVGY